MISRLLVKKKNLDCSHRKNMLFFPFFFFFTSHVLQNAAAQSVDDPVLRDGRKNKGEQRKNPQGEGRREGKRVAGEGKRSIERERIHE